jgi:catechol 2,3-dioxygenase-like lactoylglutathione lyase family enzyme
VKVRGVDFVSRPSRDVEAAIAFYEDVLGLPCAVRYGGIPGAEFETANVTRQVVESAAIGREFSPNAHPVALGVEDVAAATRAELEGRGVRFFGETIDNGVCHMAVFADPDGNALMLHHRYAPR